MVIEIIGSMIERAWTEGMSPFVAASVHVKGKRRIEIGALLV